MNTFTQTDTIKASHIFGPHEVTDEDKLAELTDSMTAHGWTGAPVVAVVDPDDGIIPVTGSHRIPAAQEARVDVPYVDIRQLLPEGVDLDEIADQRDIVPGIVPEWAIELAMAAAEHIPAETREAYGLDLH